jgi:Holliday junction resolvasome RuvABC endonuclease subunit
MAPNPRYIAGIDTSSKAVHMVVLLPNGKLAMTIKWASKAKDSDERLHEIFDPMWDDIGLKTIAFVAIEKPIYIQNPNSTVMLSKIVGCTQLMMGFHDVKYELVGNTTWKKEVLKSGRASKEEILAWAEEDAGQVFEEQDFADAYCIAKYAVDHYQSKLT